MPIPHKRDGRVTKDFDFAIPIKGWKDYAHNPIAFFDRNDQGIVYN